MNTGVAVIVPFAITFLLPGIAAARIFVRERSADLVLFLIYGALFGFGCQILIAISANFFLFLSDDPRLRVTIAALAVLALLAWTYRQVKRKENLVKITVSPYDAMTLIVTSLLGLLLYGVMKDLPNPYFNPATDQYYWLAYANRSAHAPGAIFSFFFRDPIFQPIFFMILNPYVSFLPKNLAAYQFFMTAWQYGAYMLTACAMARLAYEAVPVRTLGILAPIAFYMLHWSNYYMISTDIVPQNIGIFLLIAGFILLGRNISGAGGIAFMVLFYFTHLATFTMFVLSVGTAKVLYEGTRVIVARISGKAYETHWHIFEKIAFLPTCIVIVLYGLYAGGVLDYYPMELISYADEYAKNLTIWDQPYIDKPQQKIIWLAIAGMALIPLMACFDKERRRLLLALAFGFALPWLFLITPFIAYHAFYASWQSFRYFLVMYPSVSVLALLPIAAAILAIRRSGAENLARGSAIFAIMLMLPIMLKVAKGQQELVALDMITGRDGGVYAAAQKQAIEKIKSVNDAFPEGAVISFGNPILVPYAQWIFSPRPWFSVTGECSAKTCETFDMFAHEQKDIEDIPSPGIGIITKKTPGEFSARNAFEKIFKSWNETDSYIVYRFPRKNP